MATRARSGSHLSVSVYANTSAPSNTITVSSTGNLVTANDLSVSGTLVGYVTNAYLQATFAQNAAATALVSDKLQVANASVLYVTKATALTTNNALVNLTSDRLQVANAAVSYLTKATALSSNNAVVNLVNDRLQVANAAVTYVTKAVHLASNTAVKGLIDDRIQVANAATTYVTKAVHLTSNTAVKGLIDDRLQVANAAVTYVTKSVAVTSNNALVNLINDRLQVANLTSSLSTYWPSANAITYINANAGATDMTVNTSIFVASGGETSFAVPITSNTNAVEVYLNGFGLTRSIDWTANSTHIKGIEALAAGDILQVHEFKLHPANTLNRSAGGGGGGYSFQGSTYGYYAGAENYDTPTPYNTIQRWPFSSDTNASEIGNFWSPTNVPTYCLSGRNSALIPGTSQASHSSDEYGYLSGGPILSYPFPTTIGCVRVKWPFSAGPTGTITRAGSLSTCRTAVSATRSSSHGYAAGGQCEVPGAPIAYTNVIDKFPFATDTDTSTDVGDITISRGFTAGHSSSSYGYATGGYSPPTGTSDIIEKYPFSSDTNASDVGDITPRSPLPAFGSRLCKVYSAIGLSSTDYGYIAGGYTCQTPDSGECMTSAISKFSFSSDGNSTSVGDMINAVRETAGVSATGCGYIAGGYGFAVPASPGAPSNRLNVIQKFPFSSDSNASDVGDLSVSTYQGAGYQV